WLQRTPARSGSGTGHHIGRRFHHFGSAGDQPLDPVLAKGHTDMSKLTVWFLNVGQGDSTYFEFEDSAGKTWRGLIDCNLDPAHHGIEVIEFLADRVPKRTIGSERCRY